MTDRDRDALDHVLDGSSRDGDDPATAVQSATRKRRRHYVLAAAGAVLAASAGAVFLMPNDTTGHNTRNDASWAPEVGVSCSHLIAVGHITDIRSTGTRKVALTVAVEEAVKPASTEDQVTVSVFRPRSGKVPWQTGDRVLVRDSRAKELGSAVVAEPRVDEAERNYRRLLPLAEDESCPWPMR